MSIQYLNSKEINIHLEGRTIPKAFDGSNHLGNLGMKELKGKENSKYSGVLFISGVGRYSVGTVYSFEENWTD